MESASRGTYTSSQLPSSSEAMNGLLFGAGGSFLEAFATAEVAPFRFFFLGGGSSSSSSSELLASRILFPSAFLVPFLFFPLSDLSFLFFPRSSPAATFAATISSCAACCLRVSATHLHSPVFRAWWRFQMLSTVPIAEGLANLIAEGHPTSLTLYLLMILRSYFL